MFNRVVFKTETDSLVWNLLSLNTQQRESQHCSITSVSLLSGKSLDDKESNTDDGLVAEELESFIRRRTYRCEENSNYAQDLSWFINPYKQLILMQDVALRPFSLLMQGISTLLFFIVVFHSQTRFDFDSFINLLFKGKTPGSSTTLTSLSKWSLTHRWVPDHLLPLFLNKERSVSYISVGSLRNEHRHIAAKTTFRQICEWHVTLKLKWSCTRRWGITFCKVAPKSLLITVSPQ